MHLICKGLDKYVEVKTYQVKIEQSSRKIFYVTQDLSTQKKLPGNSKKFEVRRGRFWATDRLLLQANLAKLPKGGCMAEVGGWPAQGEGDLLGEFDWEFDSDLLGHPYIT